MDQAKMKLWAELARIWGARTSLRTELFSGRDVLQKQRRRRKENFALTVCQELTEGEDQYLTWIVVEPTKDRPISPGSPDIWNGLSSQDYILSIGPEGEVDIGKLSLLSGMPSSLYTAWQQTDQLLEGQLAKRLKARRFGLSELFRSHQGSSAI